MAAATYDLAIGDRVMVVGDRAARLFGREGRITMLPDEECPKYGYNVDLGDGFIVAFERDELVAIRSAV